MADYPKLVRKELDSDGTLVGIEFLQKAQTHKDGQFTIPMKYLREFGWAHDPLVYLEVAREGSNASWRGNHQIRSGAEVYGAEFEAIATAESVLHIVVRRPGQYAPSLQATISQTESLDREWQRAVGAGDHGNAQDYSISGVFTPGQLIRHKAFGIGKVLSASGERATVLFSVGPKSLAVGKS
jgi:hypothetical protein